MKAALIIRARRRRGLTLVEMLVAMVCTLLLMLAVTQTFQSIGEVSQKGRAAIEMSTQLRGVQQKLHIDLDSLTVPVRPWPEAGAGEGYFEIVEGQNHDATALPASGAAAENRFDILGDFDDWWAGTIRSKGEPFVGRIRGTLVQQANGRWAVQNYEANPPTYTTITSQVAEVIWFTSYADSGVTSPVQYDAGEPLNLHRRIRLVRPDIDFPSMQTAVAATFLQDNDIAAQVYVNQNNANTYTARTFTLSDLTLWENRFPHLNTAFNSLPVNNAVANLATLSGDRTGEDVMLSNLLAADIRIFDRNAPIKVAADGVDALSPGDPAYATATGNVIGYGAYINLGQFTGGEWASKNAKYPFGANVYDTWSYWYEQNGVNDGGTTDIDEGADGADNDNLNGVDDVGERETSPPYPVPLRSVQVRIRVLEPETRQVRQATVMQDFIPE